MTSVNELSSKDSYYIGALDIGSNSFHFVYARVVNDNLQILHSQKYRVKLAQGLNEENCLDQAAIDRGIQALSDIAPLTEQLSEENFRVVATFTLRQAKNAQAFLDAAAKVFPFNIEVISGHEEARLIYQGVGHYLTPNVQRLIIDIGGGSTECIIGKNLTTEQLTSLNIGCVSFAQRYFSEGTITNKAFDQAILHAKQEIESHVKRFKKTGWQQAIGTSGTIKNIYQQLNQHKDEPSAFSLTELNGLKEQLIEFGHVDHIELKNVKESRKPILASGLAILIAITEMLSIDRMNYCEYSLREGVLCEQIDAIQYKDIRDRTINSIAIRFNVDTAQVGAVQETAQQILNDVKDTWGLNKKIYKKLLNWAIAVHEIGYDINPSAYHKHGNYILLNADLPGFNVEQQEALAWLVGNQRKKIQIERPKLGYLLNYQDLSKLLCIFRIAILLNQQRQLTEQVAFSITSDSTELALTFPKGWLTSTPLFNVDLAQEKKQQSALNISLNYR